jgi:hypothetical protein
MMMSSNETELISSSIVFLGSCYIFLLRPYMKNNSKETKRLINESLERTSDLKYVNKLIENGYKYYLIRRY